MAGCFGIGGTPQKLARNLSDHATEGRFFRRSLAISSGGGEVREHASRDGSVHKKGQIIDSDTHGKPDLKVNG